MPTEDENNITRKMVILGDQGVGKTSLMMRYVEKRYDRFVSPTVGASYFTCNIKLEDLTVHLQIWDTAGQEKFKALAPMFYRNSDGAFLVYDITRPETLENIKDWVKELQRNTSNPTVLCIIGCKLDRCSERQVTTDEGIDFAHSISASYHECSALNDEGIDQIFENAASEFKKLSQLGIHENTDAISIDQVTHGDSVRNSYYCC